MAHALAAREARRNFAVPLRFLALEACGGGVTVPHQKLRDLLGLSGAGREIALQFGQVVLILDQTWRVGARRTRDKTNACC